MDDEYNGMVELGPDDIHIWTVDMKAGAIRLDEFRAVLTEDEQNRKRRDFLASRAALRTLVARYTGLEAREIELSFSAKGKPYLAGSTLHFNVSHSRDRILLAFSIGCEIGIDVEHVRPVPDIEAIAKRFFARAEIDDLLSRPEAQTAAFFRCWTRKEAIIKAAGAGIAAGLDTFSVAPLAPINGCSTVHFAGADWNLEDLHLDPNYAAAIAYSGPSRHLTLRDWPV